MKLVNFKLNDLELALLFNVKVAMGASSNTEVFRRLLRDYMEKERVGPLPQKTWSPSTATEDTNSEIDRSPYEDWKKVSEGNDPENGDWIRIESPGPRPKQIVLWYGDNYYSHF